MGRGEGVRGSQEKGGVFLGGRGGSDIPVHTMIFLRVSLPMKDARLHQIYFSFIITEDSSRLLF